jgi:hypothetical protein
MGYIDAHEAFAPRALQIIADPKVQSTGSLNYTFGATDGDYCLVAAFPASPPEADNSDYVSLVVLGTDYNNRYQFAVNTNGQVWISRLVDGAWHDLMPSTKVDGIKTAPGAENTLRIVAKDQKLTFYVNGNQVRVLRAQVQPTTSRFGFWAGGDNKAPAAKRVTTIKSYNVTEAP